MEKVEAFMKLYQDLEEYLRQHIDQEQHLSFAQRLNVLAQKYPALKRNCELLKNYGNLRNMLVHYRAPGGGWIAEPSERALQEFERIAQAILSPEKLIPRFQKSGICTFSPQDSLVTALQHMREYDYSQVVVQAEKGLSLLTVEGVARWVEEKAQDNIISVQEAIVADAWSYEQTGNVAVMNRNQTVYDAMDIFMQAIKQKMPRIYAVLITEHGKVTESLLGIVTPWDLLSIANP